jgi:hypothetical protein
VNKRLLGSYRFAVGNWANKCPTGMFRRENEFTKGPDSIAKEYFPGFDGELRLSTLPHGSTTPARRERRRTGTEPAFESFVAAERAASPLLDGRSVGKGPEAAEGGGVVAMNI